MPTDLKAVMVRKAKLAAQQQQDTCCGVLLIPLIMALLSMIAAIMSPSFAAAVTATGLY
jgi:hypothetical protein